MTLSQSLLPEFDQEMATTRSLLERLPELKAAWKPHVKSFSMGELSMHITNMVEWLTTTLTTSEFDFAPVGGPVWEPRKFESTRALVAEFDKNVAAARQALVNATDEDLMVGWSLKSGGQALFTMPRAACVRQFVLNHLIHHRGQYSVYLRLNDVPLPKIYGPTADTPM